MIAAPAIAQDQPLIGIVSISATEANNARYIQGATKAADELGYQVNVVDAAGSADQANSAIQNFAQLGAYAIIDMVFPRIFHRRPVWAAASDADIPVVTWGGGLGSTVAATNGSGGPMVIPVNDLMPQGHGQRGFDPGTDLSHR